MENSQKREEKKGRNGKENSGPSGGACNDDVVM